MTKKILDSNFWWNHITQLIKDVFEWSKAIDLSSEVGIPLLPPRYLKKQICFSRGNVKEF
jgi:hypothetical protein